MALQNNDLFLVQSQVDSKQYKITLSRLADELESGSGVNFRGSADLNKSFFDQTPDKITSVNNGDLYMVEVDAGLIDADWVMQNGETTAAKGDRVIYDGDNANWILITSGNSNAGTITNITATLPLKSNGDPVDPVLTIREARTITREGIDGDGEGTAGAVRRLAEVNDVTADTGTGSTTAVVTADLLKTTNESIANLDIDGGIYAP